MFLCEFNFTYLLREGTVDKRVGMNLTDKKRKNK